MTFYKDKSYAGYYDGGRRLYNELLFWENGQRIIFSDKSVFEGRLEAVELRKDPKLEKEFEIIGRVKDNRESDISYYVNLTGLDTFGEEIYIVNYNLEDKNVLEFKEFLKENGYEENTLSPDNFEFLSYIKEDFQSIIYLIISISTIFLFFSSVRSYIKLNKKKYYLYKISNRGGNIFLANELNNIIFFFICSLIFFIFFILSKISPLNF